MKKIEFNKVTWYSIGVLPVWMFYMGVQYQKTISTETETGIFTSFKVINIPNKSVSKNKVDYNTADWKVYKNTEYNFTFQYPPSLRIGESKYNSLLGYRVVIYSNVKGDLLDLDFPIEKDMEKTLLRETFHDSILSQKKVRDTGWSGLFSPNATNYGEASRSILVDNPSMMASSNFYPEGDIDTALVDQILSTLKFTK
jgi:hypothetical protein